MDINENANEEVKAVETEEIQNENQLVETEKVPVTNKPDKKLTGIGGWLILVAVGRIIAPIVLLYTVLVSYLPAITSGRLDELSKPGTEGYSPLWKATIYFEFIGNIFLLIFGILLIYLFFSKKRIFPNMYIGLMISTVAFALIDAFLMMKIQSTITMSLNQYTFSQLIRPIITGVIWTIYLKKSVRVKNTFVK